MKKNVSQVLILTLTVLMLMANISMAETKKEKCNRHNDISAIQFENSFFYDSEGNFLEEKGKDAIIALLKYHGYPMFDGIRDMIFVMDYNSGRFTEVGLSGIMYENNQANLYMLLDIFLLPNQMLAEHWHVDGETTAAKREGWLVRWGKSYIAGVGEDNMKDFPHVKIPTIHWDGKVEAKHIVETNRGMFVNLKQVYSKHWQMAGPKGAIITEVANFADGEAVKRSDPKMN